MTTDTCPDCEGIGELPNPALPYTPSGEGITCLECDGTGEVPHPAVSVREGGYVECSACEGAGEIYEDTDWNLDQIKRELQEGDPCNLHRPKCYTGMCPGSCAERIAWLATQLRLPGALIRYLLGERTEAHADLWDRAVGAVQRAEGSKWRHGGTDWRTDGLVLVDRGTVIDLLEGRK